jgi:hypothetical protein
MSVEGPERSSAFGQRREIEHLVRRPFGGQGRALSKARSNKALQVTKARFLKRVARQPRVTSRLTAKPLSRRRSVRAWCGGSDGDRDTPGCNPEESAGVP